jgi:alpha-tubulin suppressor-like RCC1 family protein
MWGFNLRGELGLNDTINRSSPVQVGTDTNWSKICARADGPTFIKTDGTLWTWGSNSVGQLGLNDTIHRSSPIQIGTGTTWNNLPEKSFNGSAHMLVTKTDGTLWAWGYGSSGRLGLNDTIGISSPVQVGSDTTWDKVSIGSGTSFAIKTDGTLWAWGQNGEGGYQAGALGLNDTIYRSSPTQVGTDTNWYQISGGYDFGGAAIRTNGTLWTWGRPYEAALGLNDIYGTGSWKSSPTQVGTDTNWISVSSGFAYVMAIKEV